MAIYYTYPTADDLETLLVASGFLGTLSDNSGLGLERSVDAAIERFENETLYEPFLAAGTVSTRKFRIDKPAQKLVDLGGGLIPESVTAVTLGALTDPTNNPETLEADTDYAFLPYQPRPGKPHLAFKFVSARTGVLSITGRWGYGTIVPGDAYQAILYDAALSLIDAAGYAAFTSGTEAGLAGSITEVDRGEIRIKLADPTKQQASAISQWKAEAKATLNYYRRKTLL